MSTQIKNTAPPDRLYNKSFWDTSINPGLGGIGNIDPNDVDPNVVGLATGELQMMGTFVDAGWDFFGESVNGPNDVWRMCVDGVDTPRLRWEYEAIDDWECPDGVFVEDLGVLVDEWLLGLLAFDVAPDGRDGVVNLLDFVALGQDGPPYELAGFLGEWLGVGAVYDDVTPGGGDGFFDLFDFSAMASDWMEEF